MTARAWIAVGCALGVGLGAGSSARGDEGDDDEGDVTETIDLGPQAPGPAPPPPEGEDVTERIDLGTGSGAPGKPRPPETAPPEESIEARAWLRVGATLGVDRVGRYVDDPDPFAVPHDRVTAHGQIHMRMRYEKGRKYEIVASGLLSYGLFEEDSKRLVPFTGLNGQRTRTDFEAILREAYVGFYWRVFDLRVGNQRVAWGRGDMFSPNDVINPRDLRDPVLGEAEVQRIPTFALRFDLDSGPASLQGVIAPFFRPNQADVYGSNWGALQEDAPAAYRGLMTLQTALANPTLDGVIDPVIGQPDLPPDDLSATSAGLRLRWTGLGFDGSFYLHYGYDLTPVTSVDPLFAQALAGIDFTMASASSLGPVLELLDMGIRPASSSYVRRLHQGVDLETTLGERWVVRADGAFDSQMVFTRRSDFTGLTAPSIQIMGAAEYQTGEVGKTFLVEAWYQRIESKDIEDGDLLGVNRNNAALGVLWKWHWNDEALGLELRAIVGLSPSSYLLMPRFTSKIGENTRLWVGVLTLGGDENSTSEYYRRNRGAFAFVKYSY